MVGIYEFQLHRLDREFCELFEEYLPHFGLSLFKAKTNQMRVIPLEEAVETATEVATYDRIRQVVRRQPLISVSQCICRQEQALLGKPCSKPQETCFGFGDFARFYLDNSLARQIDADEAFTILDQAEAAGLVLMPTNSKEIEAICCCCTCCCGSLRYARIAKKPVGLVLSHYQARIDGDSCTGCEDCLSRCPMIAITLTDAGVAAVNTDRCIGCGLCVPTCPSASIVMIAKPGMPVPPDRFADTIRQIKQERESRPKSYLRQT
jgi:Na+-translocating ferredoxin:NAD+ oxidoreductase subunit B